MAINGIPAKTDFDFDFNEDEFILDTTKGKARYYREVPAKKVNKAYNLVKSDPTKQIKNESKTNRRFRRKLNKESVMTPIPTYRRQDPKFYAPATSTGNANVLVNEIAKLLDKHLDNEDVDFEIKVKADEDETKWLVVNYDVIKVLYDTIKDYID